MTYVGMEVWFWQCVPKAFSVCLTVKPVGEPDPGNQTRQIASARSTLRQLLVGPHGMHGATRVSSRRWTSGKDFCSTFSPRRSAGWPRTAKREPADRLTDAAGNGHDAAHTR